MKRGERERGMIHLLLLLVFFFLSTIAVEGEGKAPRKEKLVQLVGIWDEQLTEGFSPGRPPPSANPPRSLTSRLIYNELLFFNPGPTVTLLAPPPSLFQASFRKFIAQFAAPT